MTSRRVSIGVTATPRRTSGCISQPCAAESKMTSQKPQLALAIATRLDVPSATPAPGRAPAAVSVRPRAGVHQPRPDGQLARPMQRRPRVELEDASSVWPSPRLAAPLLFTPPQYSARAPQARRCDPPNAQVSAACRSAATRSLHRTQRADRALVLATQAGADCATAALRLMTSSTCSCGAGGLNSMDSKSSSTTPVWPGAK